DINVQTSARAARERESVDLSQRAARPARNFCRHLLELERRTFDRSSTRDELERELERGRNDLPQSTNAHLDRRYAPAVRMGLGDADDRLCDRQLVHQQILGSGSPTSMSMIRRPPNAVSTITRPGWSAVTSPISAAPSQPGAARSAARASA